MATRVLPGVYVNLYDLSQFPEGAQSLNVGYVLKANRGPVNKWNLVTNPTDFLTKYTFSGQPKQTDDPTFHSILKVLAQTNSMYVVRAANNPLYGGVFVKKSKNYGSVTQASKEDKTIVIDGSEFPEVGEAIMIAGTNFIDGYYIVKEVSGNVVTVAGEALENYGKIANVSSVIASSKTFVVDTDVTEEVLPDKYVSVKFIKEENSEKTITVFNYTVVSTSYNNETNKTTVVVKEAIKEPDGVNVEGMYRYGQALGSSVLRKPIVALENQKIADVFSFEVNVEKGNLINLRGNAYTKFTAGDIITVKGSEESTYGSNNGNFTVVSASFNDETGLTSVVVSEAVLEEATGGSVYFNSLKNPDNFKEKPSEILGDDDLMLIVGVDPGDYNGKEKFSVLSSLDNKNDMVYYKGALGLFEEPCSFDTMTLSVSNVENGNSLETFTFSRDPNAKTIDGTNLYVDDVVAGSAYIKVINNTTNTDASNSTLAGAPVQASGGSNGGVVTSEDLTAALDVFKDKTIPLSILGNGCSTQAETSGFQKAMMELAVERKDLVAFLNSPKDKEKATIPIDRAQNIVNWKKSEIGSTSFYGCMYAPHVKTPDSFNSRSVEIGSDAVAIAGWLDVINNLNYPYAYAGPRNGLVTGVTTDWKIGDTSGEAELLNDASINYVAYDGKVGRYYMQTQNTLQIANSAMRNLGAVFNVLDIKENLIINLKEYIGLPVTDDLRRDILDACNDYLSPMVGSRFYNYSFQDITSSADIDQDTLRYWAAFSITRYAQRIYLAMNIVRSNFDFSILQSA